MQQLFDLLGSYDLHLQFDEREHKIYASTAATSILAEDMEKLKEVVGATKAEIHAPETEDEEFMISLTLPQPKDVEE